MKSVQQSDLRAIGEALLVLVLVMAFSWVTQAYTRGATSVSSIWLANGLALGFLLTAPRSRWPWLLAASLAGNVASSILLGDAPGLIVRGSLLNLAEIALAAWPQGRSRLDLAALAEARNFWRFLVFGIVLAPVASGAVASGAVVAADAYGFAGAAFLPVWHSWSTGHALGMASITPVVVALRVDRFGGLFRREKAWPLLGGAIAVVGVSLVVFSQTTYPLLFLLYPPLLLVALRGGFAGTTLSVLVVVGFALFYTEMGRGPFVLLAVAEPAARYRVMQLFFGSLMLSMFPIMVSIAGRQRELVALEAIKNQLRVLAEYSTDVIILTDAKSRLLYVSPAVREVLGFTPEEFLQQSYLDRVHPDDVHRVASVLNETAEWRRLTHVYRARRADGQEIWVETQTSQFQEGAQTGRVVTLRDITRRRQAELALERANQELASLVWKDGLTGLANRRRFDEALASEWAQALRGGYPLAILLVDVDQFKLFNDHYGHQRGDYCLVTVAESLAAGVTRSGDLAARYGGEEFAVILPHTPVDDAARIAERIRQTVTLLRVEHRGSPYGVLTLSVGVAGATPQVGGSAQQIVRAADEALYTSKREGRNRTTVLEVQWSQGPDGVGTLN